MCDDSPNYALQKVLVVTQTSTIFDSVVQVNIGKSTNPSWEAPRSYKVPFLLTPALNILVNTIPAMQHLHTIRLNNIFLSGVYLYTILFSAHLIHLILDTIQLPEMSTFPPTKLRKLTLTRVICSWETAQPLIAQLATSLEYLELQWCTFLDPFQLQLPSFPCLQELRYHQYYTHSMFPDNDQLNELLRLWSQVTHLHLNGNSKEPVTACRKSLQYLDTNIRMLSDYIFGTEPFPRLMHLSLEIPEAADYPPTLSSFIRDHFPTITSFHLSIPWAFRNRAMVMARFQHNVQALKLVINIRQWIDDEEDGETDSCFPVEVPDDQLHRAMLPTSLEALTLDIIQSHGELERGATRCIRWVFDHVVPFMTGSGGTGLKSISLLVSQPKSRLVERERLLSRQWVKAPDDVWHLLR